MRLATCTQLLLALVLPAAALAVDQIVLKPLPVMDEFARKETQPSLSDLLTLQSRVSIFHSYLRELEDLNARISAIAGEGLNTTILVPTNRAVMALPRKPHLPADDKEDMPVISEQQAHKESQQTLHRWIAAHFIPESPISFDATYPTLLDGVSVSFTKVDSTGAPSDYAVKVNDKADARIIDVKEAFNGIMYIIDGTIPVE